MLVFYARVFTDSASIYARYGFKPVDEDEEPLFYDRFHLFAERKIQTGPHKGKTLVQLFEKFAAKNLEITTDTMADYKRLVDDLKLRSGALVKSKIQQLEKTMTRLKCRSYRTYWANLC
jgi:hypothetical protein